MFDELIDQAIEDATTAPDGDPTHLCPGCAEKEAMK